MVSLGGEGFDFWSAGKTEVKHAAEFIQAVADTDIKGLSEDAVFAFCEGDDLGVGAGDVEEDGVGAGWYDAAADF